MLNLVDIVNDVRLEHFGRFDEIDGRRSNVAVKSKSTQVTALK